MNGGANSREPMTQMLSRKTKPASQELRPPDLHVHWLGRMEFARCARIAGRNCGEKTEGFFHPKTSCFFSNTNRFTRLGARLIDPACPPQDGFAVAN